MNVCELDMMLFFIQMNDILNILTIFIKQDIIIDIEKNRINL